MNSKWNRSPTGHSVRITVSRAGYCINCGAASYHAAQVMLHQVDRDPRTEYCLTCGSDSVILMDTQDVLDMEGKR